LRSGGGGYLIFRYKKREREHKKLEDIEKVLLLNCVSVRVFLVSCHAPSYMAYNAKHQCDKIIEVHSVDLMGNLSEGTINDEKI
jgi:hypothetical protein